MHRLVIPNVYIELKETLRGLAVEEEAVLVWQLLVLLVDVDGEDQGAGSDLGWLVVQELCVI